MQPQMNADSHRLDRLTEKIIGCAYRAANSLGSGFLEKVYENAMAIELNNAKLDVAQQKSINVLYDGKIVGEYIEDLLVENSVLVELKATRALDDIHMAQCLNYLKATGLKVCLPINLRKPRILASRETRLSV